MVSAIIAFCAGLLTAYNQARTLWNAPDMQKAAVSAAHQQYRDDLNTANALLISSSKVLNNPKSTPDQAHQASLDHAKALDLIRRSDS